MLSTAFKTMKKTTDRMDARELFRRCRTQIVLLTLAAALPTNVFGLGVLVPNQGAAAIARGNAFVATADDPSSIFYNPAGISQIPGNDVQIGALNYLGIDVNYDSAVNGHTSTDTEVLTIPQIYWTYTPKDSRVSYGLGIYSPFGLAVNWPKNSPLRSLAIDSKLTYITINPVVSWQATKTLSLAAGPAFSYGDIHFDRGLTSATDFYDFDGKDWSVGFTLGALWKPNEHWAFGVDYRYAGNMEFSGESHYRPAPAGPVLHTGTTAGLEFPSAVSFGASYRPNEKWNLEFDVENIDWNIGTLNLAGTKNIFGFNLALPLNWHPSWQYKLGVTRQLGDGWFVSAGYFFSSDTTSESNFTPAVPDTELHVGSLGFGHNGARWHWALAGQIIAGPERTIRAGAGNTDPFTGVSAAGKYSIFVPAVTVSVGYRF